MVQKPQIRAVLKNLDAALEKRLPRSKPLTANLISVEKASLGELADLSVKSTNEFPTWVKVVLAGFGAIALIGIAEAYKQEKFERTIHVEGTIEDLQEILESEDYIVHDLTGNDFILTSTLTGKPIYRFVLVTNRPQQNIIRWKI